MGSSPHVDTDPVLARARSGGGGQLCPSQSYGQRVGETPSLITPFLPGSDKTMWPLVEKDPAHLLPPHNCGSQVPNLHQPR